MSKNGKQRTVLFLCLSFIIPFTIQLISCVFLQVTPFGNHSLAFTDGKFYLNGLLFHERLLQGQENILYSFTANLGTNVWASSSWGDYNPVKLLVLFADISTIPAWFTLISIVGLSVCGVTMYILLDYLQGHRASNLLFSTSYALMGFNVVNCFQILFFIGPQMLPLMIMGLVKLLRGKSPLLYILSFAFCTFCNFYFGFMLAVASVVVFIAYLFVHRPSLKGRRKKVYGTYILSSFIGGLLPAFFWLPALKAFTGGGRLDQVSSSEFVFSENMPFIHIFSKLFSGANSTSEMMGGLPNIFCGILTVALVILFFTNNKIPLKKKQAWCGILVFYLLTFYIVAFSLAMHGFTHTNWFPYRYSFVFSFFMLCIAAEQFRYIGNLTKQDAKRCGLVILISVLLVFSTRYEFISGGAVLLDLAILLLMWFAYSLHVSHPERITHKVFSVLLMVLVSANLFANYTISIKAQQDVSGWELNLGIYDSNTFRSSILVDGINNADQSFFRMEKEFSESATLGKDASLYNYNGVGGSGPTVRMFVHKQLNKLGINWYDMRHWYSEGVPAATDSLLGLKYIITSRDLGEEKGYERLINFDESYIYKNPYQLPISILSENEIMDIELGDNAFENLNNVWKSMTGGSQNIFTQENDVNYLLHPAYTEETISSSELSESVSISTSKANDDSDDDSSDPPAYIEYSFIAQQDGPIYYFDTAMPSSSNGDSIPSIRYAGMFKKGEEVVGRIDAHATTTSQGLQNYCSKLVFAYADNDVLAKYAKQLQDRDITFNLEDETNPYGEFTAKTGQRILFTIPWDEGWTCYIDGEPVEIDKTWDLFMSVEAPEGSHTYELRFFPAWMDYGIAISGVALMSLIGYMIWWHRRGRKNDMLIEVAASDDGDVKDESAIDVSAEECVTAIEINQVDESQPDNSIPEIAPANEETTT